MEDRRKWARLRTFEFHACENAALFSRLRAEPIRGWKRCASIGRSRRREIEMRDRNACFQTQQIDRLLTRETQTRSSSRTHEAIEEFDTRFCGTSEQIRVEPRLAGDHARNTGPVSRDKTVRLQTGRLLDTGGAKNCGSKRTGEKQHAPFRGRVANRAMETRSLWAKPADIAIR